MATAVAQHGAKVIAHVDGLAASAATHVALAAAEVEIAAGAFFMIHNGWALALGDRDDMLQMAELLEKVDGEIAADYVRNTGNTLEQIKEWMDAESWFTADEAIEHGFADRLAGESQADLATARSQAWDLSAYEHAPAGGAPASCQRCSAADEAETQRISEAERDHAERARRFKLTEKVAI